MMIKTTYCQLMVISGVIFQLMVTNVGKTMPQTTHDWECRNGDDWGLVYCCFTNIIGICNGLWQVKTVDEQVCVKIVKGSKRRGISGCRRGDLMLFFA